MIGCSVAALAQKTSVSSASQIPSFKVLLTNGAYYYTKDLPANKPFVLIYFAPDCDHCMVLMDELFPKIYQLDKASVLMVTFKNPQELIPFEKKYNTLKYPNIKVGTEGLAYTLRNFYKLDKTPFVAVYNKKGKLAASYKNDTPVNEFLEVIKNL